MPLGRVSWRWKTSHRSLAVILLASTFAIIFSSVFTSHSYRRLASPDPPFAIILELESLAPVPVPTPILESARPLGAHTLTPDGLLLVNPDGPHPIFQLIRDAETAWSAKLARASTSLQQAVSEYKRRYRRAPPLGFDKWWNYVVKHHVQLPDEYDEIFEDIEPFWGIDPTEFVRTQHALESQDGHITVAKTATQPQFTVVHSTVPEDSRPRLQSTIDHIFALLTEVEQDLPPLRVTLSPHDNPDFVSDWRVKNMAREAAANGITLTSADLPAFTETGWIYACAPDSPARLNASASTLPSQSNTPPLLPETPKTFIASHRAAMDPCAHPSLLHTHGQFLMQKSGPTPRRTLTPRFSLCATLLHDDIRPPVMYGWSKDFDEGEGEGGRGAFEGDLPWDKKVDERLGWRGRTTGMWASPDSLWVHGHRARLVTLANALEGNASVLHVPADEREPVGKHESVRFARVNPAWMDIAFTDGPIACDAQGGTCDEMVKLWEFRRVQGREEEGRYKFILDVDGNGWSGRFKRLMSSNALIFKATIYPEWYTSRVAPWVHYVPIQVSYTDLYDAVAFFRVHDQLAARIAKAGRDWSRRFWRREDMTAYLYRLLLEYARVSSLDRASMDYED